MNDTKSSRPVVVCLHGSASRGDVWAPLSQAARDRVTVIAPELHGRGPQSVTDDASAVLAQVGPRAQTIHLVAHGRGSAVAACIAAIHPERVASIVLYEPAGVSVPLARRVEAPVRVLCGTRTWNAARHAAETLVESLRDASLLKLVGLRHMAPLTHPQVVNNVILDYILPVAMPGPARAA